MCVLIEAVGGRMGDVISPPLKGVRTMNRRETRQGLKQGFSSDSAFAQINAALIYSLSAAFRVKKYVFNEVRI